jgi:hypothetical protein
MVGMYARGPEAEILGEIVEYDSLSHARARA